MSKRLRILDTELQNFQPNSLENTVEKTLSLATAKCDESIDLAISLNLKAKKNENVRGSFLLPNGIAQKIRVAVFTVNNPQEALDAGADFAGLEDLVDKIKSEGIFFDVCLSTQEAFPKIMSIAKTLGQARLMPNNKDGTIVSDISTAVKNLKEGRKAKFNNDANGNIHLSIGKKSMGQQKLLENLKEAFEQIRNSCKNKEMIKKIFLSPTFGRSIEIPSKFF